MNHRIVLISAFLISVVFTGAVFAQYAILQSPVPAYPLPTVLLPSNRPGFLMGVKCGVNFVRYSTESFTSSGTMYKNGSGIAPLLGITVEFPLTEYNTHFILMEALYDSKSGHFTSENSSNTLSATATYLNMCIGYKHNLFVKDVPFGPGLSILLGFGLPLAEDQPADLSQAKRSPVRLNVCGEFTYDIPLIINWYKAIIVTPLIGYDFPVTLVDNSARNWRASSIYGGISVRMHLY